jgi:hypothetical protein
MLPTAYSGQLYYEGTTNGSYLQYGTVTSSGSLTLISTPAYPSGYPSLTTFTAPNGTLYAYYSPHNSPHGMAGGDPWGTFDSSTGTFTQIGTLPTNSNYYIDPRYSALSFDPSGNLWLSLEANNDPTYGYDNLLGKLNLTTGSFSVVADTGQFFVQTMFSTPEPSAFGLLGVGAMSLLAFAWRKRRAA